jgi:Sigma-70, region 4
VKLAMSKLNPRHREVLVASIYEEKSTAEIAAQVGLSENATLQLLFRARGAFKKALLGDVDTEGMSMAAILSVAARKAGEEAKKYGVQAMVLVLFLALGVGALFNFNRGSQAHTVASQTQQSTKPVAPTASQPDSNVTKQQPSSTGTVVANTAAKVEKEVPLAPDLYERFNVSSVSARQIVQANSGALVSVNRAAKGTGTRYMLDANNGLSANFNFDQTRTPVIQDLVFTVNIDGILYSAYGRNLQVQVSGNQVSLNGQLSDLIDLNGLVYTANGLSRAAFALNFELNGNSNAGNLTLTPTN